MRNKTVSRKTLGLCLVSALALLSAVALRDGLAQQSGPRASVVLELAVGQNAPITIASATSTREYVFERASVKNNSEDTVSSVTFGALLHPPVRSEVAPGLLSGRSIPTAIGPGQERTIDVYFTRPAALIQKIKEMKLTSATAELGVLAVEFEHGAPWNYDPLAHGGFVPARTTAGSLDPTSSPGCRESVSLGAALGDLRIVLAAFHFAGAGNPGPLGYFSCVDTDPPQCTYCTNNLTSCTVSLCPMNAEGGCINSQCAHQTCMYNP